MFYVTDTTPTYLRIVLAAAGLIALIWGSLGVISPARMLRFMNAISKGYSYSLAHMRLGGLILAVSGVAAVLAGIFV